MEECVSGFPNSLYQADKGLRADAAFHFGMDRKDMDASRFKIGDDSPLAIPDPCLFEAGKIGRNLHQVRPFMDKRLCRPCTAQVIQSHLAHQRNNTIINEPPRGGKRCRSFIGQDFKTLQTATKPLPNPLFRLPEQFILPSTVVPCMELNLVTLPQETDDQFGKR